MKEARKVASPFLCVGGRGECVHTCVRVCVNSEHPSYYSATLCALKAFFAK